MIPALPTAAQDEFTVDVSGVEEHPTPVLYKLEHSGTGSAEWVLTYANTGESSVKLTTPASPPPYTDGSYGKILMPLEMDFEDLTSFSFWFNQIVGTGIPFHEIHVNVETGETVTINGQDLTSATGRIMICYQPLWADDPAPHYGSYTGWNHYGHGATLDTTATGQVWKVYWGYDGGPIVGSGEMTWTGIKSAFGDKAQVKDVRVELRYTPDASTVYVDDITINTLTYTPEQDGVHVGNVLTVSGTGVTAGEIVEVAGTG